MKKVDTAKKRRIIKWIIILIVLFILLTGLSLLFFSMTRSCFSSVNECIPSRSLEYHSRESMKIKDSIQESRECGSKLGGDFLDVTNKNMDPDDLENAMEEMESNRR